MCIKPHACCACRVQAKPPLRVEVDRIPVDVLGVNGNGAPLPQDDAASLLSSGSSSSSSDIDEPQQSISLGETSALSLDCCRRGAAGVTDPVWCE